MALITGSFDKNNEAQSPQTDYKKLFEDLEKFLTDLLSADSYIPVPDCLENEDNQEHMFHQNL